MRAATHITWLCLLIGLTTSSGCTLMSKKHHSRKAATKVKAPPSQPKDLGAQINQQLTGVVKIESSLEGVNLRSIGSGFFVHRSGLVVTSFHILRNAAKPGVKLKISTRDGQVTEQATVLACGDKRDVDLCLIRIPIKAPYAFKFHTGKPPALGSDVHVIGHPQGFDYTLSKGNLSALRPASKPSDIDIIQITAPISPGNSGGPVLDESGKVLGISTAVWSEEGTQNINFAVSAKEVNRFVRRNLKQAGQSFEHFVQVNTKEDREQSKREFAVQLKPSYDRIMRLRQAPDDKFFQRMEVPVGKNKGQAWFLRQLAQNCQDLSNQEWSKYRCSNQNGFLEVQSKAGTRENFVASLSTGTLPITLVEDMQQTGEWQEVVKRLRPDQIAKFYSKLSSMDCRARNRMSWVKSAPAQADFCVQRIANFPDLGGVMVSILGFSQKDGLITIASAASLYGHEDYVIERYAEMLFHSLSWK